MIRYQIDEQLGVVIARMEGEVYYQELVDWHHELWAQSNYAKHYKGIGDQRGACMKLSPEEVEAIARLGEESGMTKGRWALLVDAPRETALAMVYGDVSGEMHEMRPFATEAAASAYLGLDVAALLARL